MGPIVPRDLFCPFCKRNGEAEVMYRSHNLHSRQPNGHRYVECPILQKHKCELCGATGIYAHTASYCQYSTSPSVYLSLVKSTHQSDGKRRKKFNMH